MSKKKPLTKLTQNALQRRLSVALAGAGSGARLLGSHAGSVFKNRDDKARVRRESLAHEARLFTRTLGELKGAYVKIGQMMAMYGEQFLPNEVSSALRELEHQTEPLDWSAIEPVINQELAAVIGDFHIETTALAAASLSQVHRATHHEDGQLLCIKVQYPGVAKTIDSDFKAVLQMLRLARWLPSGKEFELWLQDIKTMLKDEVDYHRESLMTTRVAELLAHDSRYLVPTVYPKWSSPTVLTMDFVQGHHVSEPCISKLSQRRRNHLAQAMLENFFLEVFEWGLMQTDPNYGNYLIQLRPDRHQPDKLVLLDFGAVRELPSDFMQALQTTILSAHLQDKEAVIKGAIALGCLRANQAESVKKSFADFCILLMEPFKRDHSDTPKYALNPAGQYNWHDSKLLTRVGKVGAKAILTDGFSSPPKEFALIARKLSGVFSFISELRAEFNATPFIEKYL